VRPPTAKDFFSGIQNKLVYGLTGRTAAELILERANAQEPNMGLKTWKGAIVRKIDITISKNYFDEGEIRMLNLLTTQFLAPRAPPAHPKAPPAPAAGLR
jgi:hypothetical protein